MYIFFFYTSALALKGMQASQVSTMNIYRADLAINGEDETDVSSCSHTGELQNTNNSQKLCTSVQPWCIVCYDLCCEISLTKIDTVKAVDTICNYSK